MSPVKNVRDGLALAELVQRCSVEFAVDKEDVESCHPKNPYSFDDMLNHVKLECIDIGENDEKKGSSGSTPFCVLAAEMSEFLANGKIKKRRLREGSVKVQVNAVVYAHYNCYAEMEEVPFDSSYLRSQKPEKLRLGEGTLYPGFEIAVMSMTVGEKAEFLIHPDLAFGECGCLGRIPPKAWVLLILEIFKSIDLKNIQEHEPLSLEDRKDFSKLYPLVKRVNSKGNRCFNDDCVMQAVSHYNKAERLLTNCSLKSDDEEKKWKHLMLKVLLNLTIAFNCPKMRSPKRAIVAVRKAFDIDPDNTQKSVKFRYNRGLAYIALSEYRLALVDFKRAQRLLPGHPEIAAHIKKIEKEIRKPFVEDDEVVRFEETFASWRDVQVPDVIDEEYKLSATRILEDFAQDEREILKLASEFTYKERKWLKTEISRLKLSYSETPIAPNKFEVIITKNKSD